MATFYGQVKGNGSTTASRQGSYDSHIASSVQSYKGSITTEMFYPMTDDDKYEDQPWIQVYHHVGTGIYGNTIFRGPLKDYIEHVRSYHG